MPVWFFILAVTQPLAAPVIITSDNMELMDAGTLVFEPDLNEFHVAPPPGPKGLSFTTRLWVNASGNPISCSVSPTPLADAAQTGCAQLISKAHISIYPGMAMQMSRGFVDVGFSFYMNPPGSPGLHVYALEQPVYVNASIIYPPDTTKESERLTKDDGSFVAPVAEDDYPSIAMRDGLESHSLVLLGIGRDGKPRTCRPLTSSIEVASASLDNYSCQFLMRRGHFDFITGFTNYDGLRFWRQKISWALPR